ncbi:MAG TPA: hypothetical protein VGM75_34510 [Pseudonocardiaceae bacterium]|jgi:hypothetical protein
MSHANPANPDERPVPLDSLFVIAEQHDVGEHQLRVLEPASADWLAVLAEEYRRLRTIASYRATALSFDGLDLAVDEVARILRAATVPHYEPGNFGVVRSDLAEVILGLIGEQLYGSRYGYRSVTDRELVQRPGRGIDQIGVEIDQAATRLTLVLGEAKVSTEQKSPPGVVDRGGDCLRAQHLAHLHNRDVTADKVWAASRRCADPETQELLRLAAELFRRHLDDKIRVVASSLMVRPSTARTPRDFGTFHTASADFRPAHIRFLLIRVPGDVDEVAMEFARLARGEFPDGRVA